MENLMTPRETVQAYYHGLNQKRGWETVIGADMVFNGPNTKIKSKDDYVSVTIGFLQVVKSVEINKLIVEGDNVCAIAHYELVSPKGNTSSCDIAEVFTIKDGKIEASVIFFDTAAFREFMSQG